MTSKQATKLLGVYNTDAHGLLVGDFLVPASSQHQVKVSSMQKQHNVPDLKNCSNFPAQTDHSTAEALVFSLRGGKLKAFLCFSSAF